MAKQGIPVVLVENGTPVILGNKGVPITIVGGHGGAGEVVDNQVVPVTNSAGGDAHDANATVSGGQLTGLELQNATASFIDDGDTVTLKKADGSGFVGGATTAVASVASGVLAELRLPGGETILKDQQASINIGQFDGTFGPAATVNVSNNEPSLKLANSTTRIVIDSVGCTVVDQSGKTAPATISVSQGLLGNFPLSNATDAFVSDTDSVAVADASAKTVMGSAAVATGMLVGVSLPGNAAIVTNTQALTGVAPTGTYTNTVTFTVANGVITGIVLS